jgi:hypothetical protein
MVPATLSDLPTELLLVSFRQLEAASILNIGLTCRVLNRVAVPVFLERMGTPNPQKLAVIRPERAGCADTLTGLTVNFALTRIERFVCVLDSRESVGSPQLAAVKPLTRNIQRICQLIGRLSLIGSVSLVFHFVGSKWTLPSDVVWNFFTSFVELLELLILKSCTSFQIVHTHPLNFQPRYNFQRGMGPKISPFQRFSRLFNPRSSVAPTGGLHLPVPILAPNTLTHSHITSLDFRMDFLLVPPLLGWTLVVMKHSPITSLTLSAIQSKRQREFCHSLLPEIVQSLPGLQEIKLQFEGNGFLPTILEKLPLFPQLQKIALALTYGVENFPDPTFTTSIFFPKLTSLTASLEQTLYFFSQNITCPSLASIGIIHTFDSLIEPFGIMFSTLISQFSLLHLEPSISLCLYHICDDLELPELDESEPPGWVTSLHAISKLTLGRSIFRPNQRELAFQIARVLYWLSLFRGVKRLTVVNYQLLIDPPAAHGLRQEAIREAIAAAFPDIDFVNLVQLKDKFHYHWSSAKTDLERAVDGIPNVYLQRNKATDYFVCCDL